MRFNQFLFITIIPLLFTACETKSFQLFQTNETVVKTVSDKEYEEELEFEWKITKGDRVEIIVQNQSVAQTDQQLSMLLNTAGRGDIQVKDGTEGILIPKNGTVRLPLVNVVKIAGLTEDEAAAKLHEQYKKYLKNPFVSVKILNQKLFVLGEVNKPGVVQVTNGTMSLFEALAYSGDLTDDAKRTNVKVIRGGMRKPMVKEINLAELSDMTLTSLILQPNDIVYVQPRDMKAYNVAFKEQMPFFEMVEAVLSPFLTVKTINNLGALDVFLLR
ncbi:MAG: polysaccharide biosynthesis/export family protein [Campylobacterales bacterium]|nr:polysaccharide biosynthesis/export family protein [Campylobacterales bacterium]